MRKFFIKNISYTFLFLITNQIFSAGANLSIAPRSNVKSVRPTFYSVLFGQSVVVGGCIGTAENECLTVTNNESKKVASGSGFTQINWAEELEMPDQDGNRFVFYSLALPSKIEGIEGWRDWIFIGNGRVHVGNSGLLKALGVLIGNKQGAGINAFSPRDWFPK